MATFPKKGDRMAIFQNPAIPEYVKTVFVPEEMMETACETRKREPIAEN